MQAIVTKYHGPTNYRGSRISAKADAGRVTVPYDHAESNPHDVAALALCSKLGWNCDLVEGEMPDNSGNCYVILPGTMRNPGPARVVR